MKAPFSLFFALRYLQPKRTFVSLISIVSVLGVTLGVGVMILVISVMTGFDQELRNKVLGFEPHLLATGPMMKDQWRAADEQLKKAPGILATAPFVQGPVILSFNNTGESTPILRGIDFAREEEVTHLSHTIKHGAFDLEMDAEGKSNKVVMGAELAGELGAHVGDVITVYAPGNIGGILEQIKKAESNPEALKELRSMVLPAELTITGIFSTGRFLYDANYLLVSLSIAQELNGMGDGVMGISVRTSDPYSVEDIKNKVYDTLPTNMEIDLASWIDQNHELFDALAVERNTMFFLLLIIIVVAAFSIMNTLITVTTQKTREIGVMKALGATTAQIVWVFLLFGIVVDLLGTALGVGGAFLLIRWRNDLKAWLWEHMHIHVFPASIYQFSEIPAKIVPSDVAIICVSSFFICAIAAFIPAFFAARLDPVKALRFE